VGLWEKEKCLLGSNFN